MGHCDLSSCGDGPLQARATAEMAHCGSEQLWPDGSGSCRRIPDQSEAPPRTISASGQSWQIATSDPVGPMAPWTPYPVFGCVQLL